MVFVLDSLIGIIMNKLVDAGIKKIANILEVESEMEALKGNMKKISLVLVDAESKKIEDKSINHWLAELREVAYDVEDLLDDFTAAKLGKSESFRDTTLSIPELSRGKNNSSTSESVKDTTLCIPCWPFRGKNNSSTSESVKDTTHCIPELSRDKNNSSTSKSVKDTILSFPGFSQMTEAYLKSKISTRIGNINSNLSRINSETPTLQLLRSLPDAEKKVSRYNSSRINETSSIEYNIIVGIDDDAADLADRIIGDNKRAHSLFAITGMGGIGKTTLARKVFNHHLIKDHFNNTVWVCVSSNSTGEYLLKTIVRSIDKNYSESRDSFEELSTKLIEVLKEKRVFIVLDDVWDSHVWKKFLGRPLLKGENYIRILITTRNKQVAMKMNATHTHAMRNMLQSDGWSMLCKIVFQEEDKGDMDKLADVGKQIVDRCKGLPLAIEVVGGVLRMTEREIAAWTRVLSSTTWSMPDLPEDVLPILLLSYEDLPLHLKQCFTYCSLFPEDYKFSRFELENLWIAEGFIKKVEGMGVEYSARDYYNELVMRNLLQVFNLKYYNTYCKMHDLLRCLAIFVSQKQYIYLQSNNSSLTRRHHLSFIGNDKNDEEVSHEIKEEDRVRTLLLSRNPRITMVSSELLSRLRQLRVLDLQGTRIETFPDSLGDLIHLKFLHISYTGYKELKLPDSIRKLKNLEYLQLQVFRLNKMPNGLDNMKNLRILDRFVVNDRRRQYTPNLKELKDLSQLTHLSISNLERVASKEEAQEAAIEKKTRLERLTLSWYHDNGARLFSQLRKIEVIGKIEKIEKIEEVFAGIRIPQNLKDLHIYGFLGKQLPDHMTSDRLRQLTSLRFNCCPSLTRLPSLGNMPELQILNFFGASSVVELGSEFLGSLKFPKLQELELWSMRNLERMFDVEEGAFPCLVKLSIDDCPKLNSLGEGWNHATCLETLEVSDVENLKSIENLTSISEVKIERISRLKYVKNLPSLKRMTIRKCPALEDVNEVGELDFLCIVDFEMKTLPRWLENITPPKKLHVDKEELVLGIHYNSKSTGSSGASSSSVTIT